MARWAKRSRVDELGRMEVLRYCDRHELALLARMAELRTFSARDVVCRAGGPADEAFLVRSGSLRVQLGGEVVATVCAGSLAGELAPLGGTMRCADLVAQDHSEVYVLRAADLRRALSECPGLRRSITRLVAERVAANDGRAAG